MPFKYLILCFGLMISHIANAQFGARAKYNINSYPAWEELISELDVPNIEVGVDYWFKLKNHRVEFMPEVYYGLKSTSEYLTPTGQELFSKHGYLGFQLNTHIYIMDLVGDCDCPTFSKQGPSIKKGFFVNIAPGIVYNNYERKSETQNVPNHKTDKFNARIGLGIGYDIGINDLITITPIATYLVSPSNDSAYTTPGNTPILSSWNSIQFGLRVGFRPDYTNQYGRR